MGRGIIAEQSKQVLNRLSSADTAARFGVAKNRPFNDHKASCYCRNKSDCPLEEKCRTTCVIYKALICTPNGKTISYYCCFETNFKAYNYNHKQSFKTLS